MGLHFRKHIRLPGCDYIGGAYFVTLCTRSRMQVLGHIVGTGVRARMELTDVGHIVDECWRAIPDHFPHARLDETQIMPDHLHAILVLDRVPDPAIAGATRRVAATVPTNGTGRRPNGPRPGSLGAMIAAFKSETTKRANRMNAIMGQRLWQPNYYERIIRDHGGERERIALNIAENPANWR